MSEKLQSNRIENSAEAMAPAERFRVNSEDYPIFRKQVELSPEWGNNEVSRMNIDQTMSRYVTDTANLIARIDGTAKGHEKEAKLDHVVYLDKSARPVSWAVNEMWDEFSDEKRPGHSYLNIDRLPWFRRAGIEMDAGGYMQSQDGTRVRPKLEDFMKNVDNLPPEIFARIRALYIPGGVETEDLDEIMKMPTSLDGKNVLIIDEVSDTGSTLGIAKYLLKRAIPELASVNGDYFWSGGFKSNGLERQQLSVPVWYSHDRSEGRGVGDVNEPFFAERYRNNPTPRTRAQMIGALALSEPVDLGKEEGNSSRELMREIKSMHRDFRDGKILMRFPKNWTPKRMAEMIRKQGLRLAPESDKSPDTFINVAKAIDAREAV